LAQVALEITAQVTQALLLHFHHSHQPAAGAVDHLIHNWAETVVRVVAVLVAMHRKQTQAEQAYQVKVTLVELTIIQQEQFHPAAVVVNQQQALTEHLVLVEQAEQE
jgi:hypothetical protein